MHTLIVGAGPGGAALALLLARAGLEVTLVEREPDAARVFRGEGLMPTGLDALYQMGLRDDLNALPWRHLESWDIYLDRQLVMHVPEPTRELGDLALRAVSQPALLELLVARCREHGGFRYRAPLTVRDLLRDRERGRVRGVVASGPGGEEEIAADLVIGADGRSSLVRRRAGLDLALLPESYDVLWFKLPLPPELADRCPVLIFASGPDAILAYRSWDDRLQVAWMMSKGAWKEARERDWLAEAAALMPEGFARHVLAHRDALDGPVPLDVMVGRSTRWWTPGLLLLGDAAHPMSPIRAQGINMALRDAIVAANHLVPALRGGEAPDAVLAAIQGEREREVVRAQALQYREARGQRWARERPWLMKPMLALVPLLMRSQLVRRWIAASWLRQQRELRHGVTRVELRV
jgi:2-polyprenyl-6-methoxyphenol hydroxylase-like FAD-dependent oxidoreductase